jgi:7-keto-8-aminopelargonate synthetase-like enzyme
MSQVRYVVTQHTCCLHAFQGLAGNETIKMRVIEALRKYGVGSCGPPRFYGTLVHLFALNFLLS